MAANLVPMASASLQTPKRSGFVTWRNKLSSFAVALFLTSGDFTYMNVMFLTPQKPLSSQPGSRSVDSMRGPPGSAALFQALTGQERHSCNARASGGGFMASQAATIPSYRTEYGIWRVISASAVGTMIEWYDFYIFGSLAAILSPKFYPPGNETFAFIAYLATFAVGFVVRPFG